MSSPVNSRANGPNGRRPPPRQIVFLLALVALTVALLVVHRLFSPPPGPGGDNGSAKGSGANGSGKVVGPRTLTAEESRRLNKLKGQAIGLMENLKVAEADALWEQMAESLPDEPLIAINRALGRLLALEAEKADRSDEAFARARSALADAQKLAPQSWIGFWIEGRLEILERDRTDDFERRNERIAAAARALAKASELAPDRVVPRYQLHEVTKEATDPELVELGRRALSDAHRLEPTNLTVFLAYLDVAVETRAPDLARELESLRKILGPINDGVKRRSRVDLATTIASAIEAVEKGDWGAAMGTVRRVGNVVRPDDIQRADYRRTLPNALELLVYDFASVQLADAPPDVPAAIEVRFAWRDIQGLIPAAGDVRDLRVVDVDLDGQLDVVVLDGERLLVFGRVSDPSAAPPPPATPDNSTANNAPPSNSTPPLPWQSDPSQWRVILETPVGPGYERLLVADFDMDNKLTSGPRAEGTTATASPPVDPAFYVADADFVLHGPAGVLVLRNERSPETQQRSLVTVEQDGGLEKLRNVSTATLADFDHDGDLDLALVADNALTLWTNRGNITFDNVTASSTLPSLSSPPADLVAVDWDRDIDADILIADASGKLVGYLENLRHIEFRWRELPPEFAALRGASSLAIVESDGNASWDVLVASETGVRLQLTSTPVPGGVRPLRAATASTTPARRILNWDYDNDGFPDALAWGESAHAYRGTPDGSLQAVEGLLAGLPRDARSIEPVDIDGDGDLDLIVATEKEISVWTNEGGNRNRWLDILVRGLDEDISGRVNHFGLGSWIELRTDGRYQAQLVTRPYTHFGLGAAEKVDVVRVMFTNGVPQSVLDPVAGTVVREAQALKGSCPYLYVWNGERFEFYTDLLWNAPLGLQIADGVLLRDRPWEFLKIEGERLRAVDGVYRIQITEELWEAGYFDQVELIAVDHPADIEVFTNEKVGPAEIAQRKIHTVRQRRRPVSATDAYGRDLVPLLADRDDRFAQCFQRTFRQGLAEPHYLELDLGPLDLGPRADSPVEDSPVEDGPREDGTRNVDASGDRPRAEPRRVTLFLTGWINPTDTSLNIGLSQNRELDGPRPPSLLVPDGQGGWREALGFMGFPGGKTKTIAVDLTGLLVPGDARVRIATSAEIRWDEAFFTVDEPPVEVRETTLPLQSAHLHYRGVSLPLPRPSPAVPWRYDYDRVETAPVWPPMAGRFTRYGDVHELLTHWDDRMVVLGSGDEMTLEFAAGPPLPPGWKRDFLLHSVGWDKDADIHTVYGQSVEPLPFRAMPAYPYSDSEYPSDEQTKTYLRTYQTREQAPASFWRLLQSPP